MPRSVVIHSGARLRAEHERLIEVHEWVTREQLNIEEDPSFWVVSRLSLEPNYPWEGMEVSNDSVVVRVDPSAQDVALPYQIYGHLHLMVSLGRQAEWLPEAPDATGFALERAIMKRVSDAWLLGRTAFDTAPNGPLDELVYATEAGFLDAFIFTARPGEFAGERARWARENPGDAEAYRTWFLETFNREPPGLRVG